MSYIYKQWVKINAKKFGVYYRKVIYTIVSILQGDSDPILYLKYIIG